jgi:hypothetical protein
MGQIRFRSAVVSVCVVLFWLGVCVTLGVLVFYYNRFTDVFTMHGEQVRDDLPGPYNLALVRSTDVDLAARRVGVLGMSAFWQFDILPDERAFIAYSPSPVALHVDMPGYVRSLRGLWQGGDVKVSAMGALRETLTGDPGRTRKTWGTTLPKGARRTTPFFEVSMPINRVDMERSIEDRAIEINTSFSVTYPASSGPGFRDAYRTIEHRCWLIPLSPSELDEYKAVRRDYRLRQGLLTGLTGLGIALLVGGVLCGGSLLLGRRFDTR